MEDAESFVPELWAAIGSRTDERFAVFFPFSRCEKNIPVTKPRGLNSCFRPPRSAHPGQRSRAPSPFAYPSSFPLRSPLVALRSCSSLYAPTPLSCSSHPAPRSSPSGQRSAAASTGQTGTFRALIVDAIEGPRP